MYNVFIKKKAQKQLAMLPLSIADRIALSIDSLALQPRPAGAKKLQGYENLYRIRVGNYRIVYSIEDAVLTIEVIKIGHRQGVYND
ncbi:RelE/StbE family addiction module toxin [Bacteroidia bacterium]|nr:RelE/StbE family addiction module toxin [Bacteroidia bacterium]GHT82174.1 RelE/StbE family addiction module toxin [Bacteroidia bacterium]